MELKQYRGRPVLLNFWATWCLAPPREEMPEMEQLYRRHRDDGKLVVLAVSIDTEQAAKDVPEYLQGGRPQGRLYTFPVALDTGGVARAYRLGGVPASYFIDDAGVIRAVRPGAMDRALMIDLVRTITPPWPSDPCPLILAPGTLISVLCVLCALAV